MSFSADLLILVSIKVSPADTKMSASPQKIQEKKKGGEEETEAEERKTEGFILKNSARNFLNFFFSFGHVNTGCPILHVAQIIPSHIIKKKKKKFRN